jgi:hypothetical protein
MSRFTFSWSVRRTTDQGTIRIKRSGFDGKIFGLIAGCQHPPFNVASSAMVGTRQFWLEFQDIVLLLPMENRGHPRTLLPIPTFTHKTTLPDQTCFQVFYLLTMIDKLVSAIRGERGFPSSHCWA